jgi:undecaprenyl-diphosphatase
MSIPVIGGAGFLQFLNVLESGKTAIGADILIIGLLSAAISGYLAIKILLKVLKEKKLNYFSYYCWTAALVVVLLTYFKG